jgi:sarcosine oxidase subunit alpha
LPDELRVLSPAVPRLNACAVDFEGIGVPAFEGESLAVALWAAGIRTLGRSTKFHRPRGAFCFEGHCGSCFLRVDGRPSVRACMTPARDGLRCNRQNSFPSAELDLLAAADWMFPDQMDHHTLMTGNRVANRLLVGLVRQMGGSGTLPDAAPRDQYSARAEMVDVCIVGAGPAGLTAAATLAREAPAMRVLVVDDQCSPGGSWLAEPGGTGQVDAALSNLAAAPGNAVQVLSGAVAIGFFSEDLVESDARPDAIRGTLAVTTATGLLRVSARRLLYATGAYDQNLPFFDNDRPGIISARACGRLSFRHGLRPGRRVAVIAAAAPRPGCLDSGGDYAHRLVTGLIAAGLRAEDVQRIDTAQERVVAARGATTLRGLIVASDTGQERRVAADVIAVAAIPAPASELPRQHGLAGGDGRQVVLDECQGGFAAQVDEQFRLRDLSANSDKVFCCGDVTGYRGPAAAAASGAAAAAAERHKLEPK